MCGKKDLIETVSLHSFIGQEAGSYDPKPGYYRSVGRGYKLDRQEIVGTLATLQRWVKMDHNKERIDPARQKTKKLQDALSDVQHLSFSIWPEDLVDGIGYHQLGLKVTFEKKTADEVANLNNKLRDSDPSIWLYHHGGNSLDINALNLADGDEKIISDGIKRTLFA